MLHCTDSGYRRAQHWQAPTTKAQSDVSSQCRKYSRDTADLVIHVFDVYILHHLLLSLRRVWPCIDVAGGQITCCYQQHLAMTVYLVIQHVKCLAVVGCVLSVPNPEQQV